MRKVILNMKELEKYQIIKKLVEGNGNKKSESIKIGCSIKTINRLINVYKQSGKLGFSHKSKGKPPAIKIHNSVKRNIIDDYINNYSDANITHFLRLYQKNTNYLFLMKQFDYGY